MPPFWGKSDEEGYFILSGKGVETVGHGTFEIEKYDAIYLLVNTVHIVKNNGHEQLWVLYVRKPNYKAQ